MLLKLDFISKIITCSPALGSIIHTTTGSNESKKVTNPKEEALKHYFNWDIFYTYCEFARVNITHQDLNNQY